VDFGSLGSLDIEAGRPINYAGPLDIEDQDLAHSMPAFEFSGPSRLRAAHLQIDLAGRTPVTRRVLALLILKLSNGIETLQLEQLTREAERQVLAVNLNFYRTLLRLANDRTRSTTKVDPVISACSVVAEVQLRKLAQYRDRWGIT
jgi:hypothetical protein